MRMLEGMALLDLHRPGERVRAFSDAITAADAPQARVLALSGLAAATDDPARATEAGKAFARAYAAGSAAGVPVDAAAFLVRSPVSRADLREGYRAAWY